jgi:hypothetical protein
VLKVFWFVLYVCSMAFSPMVMQRHFMGKCAVLGNDRGDESGHLKLVLWDHHGLPLAAIFASANGDNTRD